MTAVDTDSDKVCPVLVHGRTLVPVSRIVAAFGGESTWDAATRDTGFLLGGRTVRHKVGSNQVRIGGKVETMDAPSMLKNNRTYVPVRYILEGLGLWVGYEPTYRLVVVSTEDLSGQDLIDLEETQRLFASETVPNIPRGISERYTIDGFNYTMEVGEALTLFNSQSPIGDYYAYSWDVLDGGELVKVDRDGATCRFYAKRPGVVTIQSHLDETILNYFGPSRHNEYTYTMTITINPATGSGGSNRLMHYQTCPSCGGSGKIKAGSSLRTCPTCSGRGSVLL